MTREKLKGQRNNGKPKDRKRRTRKNKETYLLRQKRRQMSGSNNNKMEHFCSLPISLLLARETKPVTCISGATDL